MSIGTNLNFKLEYFISATYLSRLLLYISIADNFIQNTSPENICIIFSINSIYFFLILTILLDTLIVLYSTIKLNKRLFYSGNPTIHLNLSSSNHSLINKNGDIISFMLGVIFPSAATYSSNNIINIFLFLLIQLFIYKLMVRSSSIFPNVILIVFFNIDIYNFNYTYNNKEKNIYVLCHSNINKSTSSNDIYLSRLGDSIECNTYRRIESRNGN